MMNRGHSMQCSPGYLNTNYLSDVTLISKPGQRVPSPCDIAFKEKDLIACAKLTSSEREASSLRLSNHFESESSSSKDNRENGTYTHYTANNAQERNEKESTSTIRDEQSKDSEDEVKEEAVTFYKTHIDESSLIAYANLTDDGIQEEIRLAEQAQSRGQVEDTRLNLDVNDADESDSNENHDGCITPVNSDAGEKPTSVDNKEVEVFAAKGTNSKLKTEDVSHDVHFSGMIQEVISQLAYFEMDETLSLFAGTGILEEGLLAGFVSPEQLMDQLQRYRFVSRDNMYHLQNIVMRLDDTDLYSRAVQYTRHHYDIVYFYQELDEPPKGFGTVRCFISGRDFTRVTREDLELVRFKVASVVFMPVQFVYIVGIEPGRRVVVTLMLLERYVQELSEMAKEGLPELSLINVDAIQIFGKTYSTAGTTAVERYRVDGHPAFLSVYQQLREKTKHLEEREHEIRELREDAEFMKLELETMGAELELLTEKAVHETIDRRRYNRRPGGKRIRTRSFPLSFEDGNEGPVSFSTPRSPRLKALDDKFTSVLHNVILSRSVEQKEPTDSGDKSLVVKQIGEIIHPWAISSAGNARPQGEKGSRVKSSDKLVRTGGCKSPRATSPAVITSLGGGRSPRAVVGEHSGKRHKAFDEKDEIMDDIQALLDELALVQMLFQ